MSIEEMNRELAKNWSEEDLIELIINCLVEHIKGIYNTIPCETIFNKVIEELEEKDFESNEELVDFLDMQCENYVELFCRLKDEVTKIFHNLGWGYNARNLSPFPIDFVYDGEKESFVFYEYYNNKVYKEINLKDICLKLSNNKFLVF